MNTAIISLTRFGDLLQIQPVVTGLKKQGHRVTLVCLSNFRQTSALLAGVDHFAPFPGAGLLSKLDQHWPGAVGELNAFAESLPPLDMVLNLTPTLSGRLLGLFLAQKKAWPDRPAKTAGFCLDECGFGYSSNSWATFLLAAVNSRGCSPFNIVDLFRRASGLMPEPLAGLGLRAPEPEDAAAARQELLSLSPDGTRGWLALQLGASEEKRQWPVNYFARLGDMISEKLDLCPVLLGSPEEKALGQAYASLAKRAAVNMIGRTDLAGLAAILANTSGLVSNDTGTMHLAAGLNLPVIGIFLATAQVWDTGPYLAGSIGLEPDMPCHPCAFGQACPENNACRQRMFPETVFGCLDDLLAGREGSWQRADNTRVWRTLAGPDGFMDLRSMSGHEQTDRTAWIRQQRFFFRHFIDESELPSDRAALLPVLSAAVHGQVMTTLEQAAGLLDLMAAQLRLLLAQPDDLRKKKFMSTWHALNNLFKNSQYFNNLGYVWLNFSQEAGDDPGQIEQVIGRFSSLIRTWKTRLGRPSDPA